MLEGLHPDAEKTPLYGTDPEMRDIFGRTVVDNMAYTDTAIPHGTAVSKEGL